MATLYEGEQLLSQYQGHLERVNNSSPQISAIVAPDTSFAGESLTIRATVFDPDGMSDLVSVQLESQSGGSSWELSQITDSLWVLDLEPNFAAGMQGLEAFDLSVIDRFDATSFSTFEIEIENLPPAFAADALSFWMFDEIDEQWLPYTVADTLLLQVPQHGFAPFRRSWSG